MDTMLDATSGDAGAIIDAARELGQADGRLVEIDPTKHVAYLRVGSTGERRLELLDTDPLLPFPRRQAARVTFFTAAAFSEYVKRHAAEGTTLWGDQATGRVVAVIDDHRPDGIAGWREHTATLQVRTTTGWDRWIARDGILGTQEEFAAHIEDGMGEIAEPDGADLLEIAQSFHATKSHRFRSDTRLTSGQVQFVHEEDIEATAGHRGELTIPSEFILSLVPFEGSDAFRVTARLRYRLRDGKLSIGYQLTRAVEVRQEAFRDTTGAIQDLTEITVWEGQP